MDYVTNYLLLVCQVMRLAFFLGTRPDIDLYLFPFFQAKIYLISKLLFEHIWIFLTTLNIFYI
jgi:hypothetical protein